MQSKELFSQDMRLIYLQLPHFTKGAEECEIDLNTIAIATGLTLQEVEKSAARLRQQ